MNNWAKLKRAPQTTAGSIAYRDRKSLPARILRVLRHALLNSKKAPHSRSWRPVHNNQFTSSVATTTTETAHGLANSVARAIESREPAPFRSAVPIAFSTARGGYWTSASGYSDGGYRLVSRPRLFFLLKLPIYVLMYCKDRWLF